MDKLAGGVLAPQKSVPLKNAVAFPCKPVEFCIAVEIVLINVLQSSQLASLKKGKKILLLFPFAGAGDPGGPGGPGPPLKLRIYGVKVLKICKISLFVVIGAPLE